MYSFPRVATWTFKCRPLWIKIAWDSNSTSKMSSTSRYHWTSLAKTLHYPPSSHHSIPNCTQTSVLNLVWLGPLSFPSLLKSCSTSDRVVATHVCMQSTTPRKKPATKRKTCLWPVSKHPCLQSSAKMDWRATTLLKTDWACSSH